MKTEEEAWEEGKVEDMDAVQEDLKKELLEIWTDIINKSILV